MYNECMNHLKNICKPSTGVTNFRADNVLNVIILTFFPI